MVLRASNILPSYYSSSSLSINNLSILALFQVLEALAMNVVLDKLSPLLISFFTIVNQALIPLSNNYLLCLAWKYHKQINTK